MSGTPSALGVNTGEAATITYESAVDANGKVVSTDGFAPNGPAAAGADVAHKYGASTTGTGSGVITYNFNGPWTVAQENQITASLILWQDVANVKFQLVASTNPKDANQTFFDDTNPPSVNDGTYTVDFEQSAAAAGTPTIAEVQGGYTNVQTTVYGWTDVASFTVADGYGITTMVHEIGHVLGLAHTGDYNANGDTLANYRQLTPYDSQQWSVMSYISPADTTQPYYNQSTVTSTNWNGGTPQTFMPLDILAVQRLYGTPIDSSLTGGQIFGFNCNIFDASKQFYDFTINIAPPIVTLYDSGTDNTLDLSGWGSVATIDLRAGHFSSADGLTNNIGIGVGVRIDNAVGTNGTTTFIVNEESDSLIGRTYGNDTAIFADPGRPWTETQIGSDTSTWGIGIVDTLTAVPNVAFTGGSDTISATARSDNMTVSGGNNEVFLFSSQASLLSSGGNTIVANLSSDTIVANSAAGGRGDLIFSQPGSALSYVGGQATDTIIAGDAGLSGGAGGVLAFEAGSGARIDLVSSVGASTIVGGPGGSIHVTGGNNGVDVGGGGGSNLIDLYGQNAVAFAGGNNDSVYSNTTGGTSYIVGGAGDESLDASGGSGEQVIYAGSGNDTVRGGSGLNIVAVGSGNVTVNGDQGINLFQLQAGHPEGNLTIENYNADADYFGVFGFGPVAAEIAYQEAKTSPGGSNSIQFVLGDNTHVTLVGVSSVGDQSHFFGG